MMAAAAATTSLRVGARVLGVDYHQPVVLAKELMTIDLLSDGRLEIGLGAGWLRAEYEAMAIPFDSAGMRIKRLEALLRILNAYMSDSQIECVGPDGSIVQGFEGTPKPVQRPRPPIMIGGGARRILELAAREADIISFNFDNSSGVAADPSGVGPQSVLEKVRWVREAAGDRFEELELDIGAYFISVATNYKAAADAFVPMLGATREDVLVHPHALIGDVDRICDELLARREAYGLSYFTVFDHNMEQFGPVVARLAGA
jgi:probable F420-dependent oxidoreductase